MPFKRSPTLSVGHPRFHILWHNSVEITLNESCRPGRAFLLCRHISPVLMGDIEAQFELREIDIELDVQAVVGARQKNLCKSRQAVVKKTGANQGGAPAGHRLS